MRVLRQRELVENYKNENEVTRLDLTRESRDARKAASSGAAQDISRLQEEGNRYIRKIESERKKIEQLDLEIADYQAKILEQKSRMGTYSITYLLTYLLTYSLARLFRWC